MKEKELKDLIKIANLDIENESLIKLVNKVNALDDMFICLEEVNVDKVEPMFSVFDASLTNFRDDVVSNEDLRSKILLNVPDKEDVFIAVKKVIEH